MRRKTLQRIMKIFAIFMALATVLFLFGPFIGSF